LVVLVAVLVAAGGALGLGRTLAGQLVSLVLGVALPVASFTIWQRLEPRSAFRLRLPPRWSWLVAPPLAAAAAAAAAQLSFWLAPVLPMTAAEDAAWRLLAGRVERAPIEAVIALALVPAIVEEALFRGLLLAALIPMLGRWKAILAASFLFAGYHLDVQRFLVQGLLGVLLGWLRVRTGSLIVPILVHLGYNLAILGAGGVLVELAGRGWALPAAVLAMAGVAWGVMARVGEPRQ